MEAVPYRGRRPTVFDHTNPAPSRDRWPWGALRFPRGLLGLYTVTLRPDDHGPSLARHRHFFFAQCFIFLRFALHGRRIRRRSRGPRLGLPRCVGQAFATEAIAECIRTSGVRKPEPNMELHDLVSIPAASDWDASITVEGINL